MTVAQPMASFALLCVVLRAGPAFAQAQSGADVLIQASVLRFDGGGGTISGMGGRVTADINRWLSVDGELTFYPNDDFGVGPEPPTPGTMRVVYHRRRTEGLAGLRVGRRGDRFGVFAKVRPGFTRPTHRGLECRGDLCALALFVLPDYRTELAVDLGGVLEFYPSARTVTRVDISDVLIRHRSSAPPCASCTTHNLTTRVGVGVRF